MQETQIWSLGWEDPLEKEMATHSSILAWKIPWSEEPGGLQSMVLESQTQLSNWAHKQDIKKKITGFQENIKIATIWRDPGFPGDLAVKNPPAM